MESQGELRCPNAECGSVVSHKDREFIILRQMDSRVKDLQDHLDAYKTKTDARVAELEKSLKEKNALILRFQGDFETLKKRMDDMQSRIRDQDALLRESDVRTALKDGTIAELNTRIDELSAEVTRLTNHNIHLSNIVARQEDFMREQHATNLTLERRIQALEIAAARPRRPRDRNAAPPVPEGPAEIVL